MSALGSLKMLKDKKSNNIMMRIPAYFFGIFLMGLGVNISKLSGLGISPVSSIPYAMELITGIKLGTLTIYFNILFIALQALILRREFKLKSSLQFFCSFFIGFSINISSRDSIFLSMLPTPESYVYRLALCFISCIVIGMGMYIYISTKLIVIPGEGLFLAIVEKSKGRFEFHKVKICGDITMVTIAAVLSIVFLGSLGAVREGTIFAALFVGVVVGWCKKINSRIIAD